MGTSLLSLCAEGRDLLAGTNTDIHYPPDGADLLGELEAHHFWFSVRRHAIVKLLRNALILPARGLDIGCGTGYNAVFLTQAGFPTVGIDVYGSFSYWRDTGQSAGFLQGDIFSIEPEPEFNFVLLLDVLEHIPNDEAFLRQAFAFLRPGGVAIVTVPAFNSLWSKTDDAAGHLRRYDKRSLKKLAVAAHSRAQVELQRYFYGATIIPYIISRRLKSSDAPLPAVETSPPALLNSLLKFILMVELLFFPLGGAPVGSSLFAVIRKGS